MITDEARDVAVEKLIEEIRQNSVYKDCSVEHIQWAALKMMAEHLYRLSIIRQRIADVSR